MPKTKAAASSDSDSGPDDQLPAKKYKDEAVLSSGVKTDEGTVFDLDRKKRVTVRQFKGKLYVDIREFYEQNGKQLPSKKGIALQPEQWRKLISMAADINAALAEF